VGPVEYFFNFGAPAVVLINAKNRLPWRGTTHRSVEMTQKAERDLLPVATGG
jgi:hypothetical protein